MDLRNLARDLKTAVGSSPKELAKGLRSAGQIVAAAAASNASWSTRIPQSIKVSGGAQSVTVRAGGDAAPHAAAFEGTKGAVFRHPVYGQSEVWVDQAAKPYLAKAANDNADAVAEEVAKVIDAVMRNAGFK
ncbi:hypothetical protein [Fodinicola feengrottensis]|uniref:hypothetical protein n=1 Tax=Fodinicola feengrottensis TaxID=435914 RepID=UPI0013D8BA29|nr:hypothetical protein [Fodinicola feengrottensis]